MTAGAAWRSYLRLYRGSGGTLAAIAAFTFLGVAVLLPMPLLIKRALDEEIPGGDVSGLAWLGVILLVLQVAHAALTIGRRSLVYRLVKSAVQELRSESCQKLYAVSIDYHRRHEVGHLHDVVVHSTTRVDGMSDTLLATFLPAALTSAGLSLVLLSINWWLYLAMMTVVPAIVVTHRLIMPRIRAYARRHHGSFGSFSDGVLFLLRSMDLTRQRAAEDVEMRRQNRRLDDVRLTDIRVCEMRTVYSASQQALIALSGVVVLVFGGIGVIRGALTIGDFFAFYAGLAMLRGPLTFLFSSYPIVVEGNQALARLYDFLLDDDARPYHGRTKVDFDGAVALRRVSFAYGTHRILSHASLRVRPGAVTMLIGPNGSGKSTVVSLILGLYRPQEGTLAASGVPYDEIDIRALRARLGVVSQEATIVTGTVAENIGFGMDVPRTRVVEAAKLAQAHEFIEALEAGYDTPISHDGLTLSGGQRQRIAIARALAADPRLLVLDEPTNHLDEDILETILATLLSLPSAPAVLLISHRSDLGRWVDHVYRLRDGRIEEESADWPGFLRPAAAEGTA